MSPPGAGRIVAAGFPQYLVACIWFPTLPSKVCTKEIISPTPPQLSAWHHTHRRGAPRGAWIQPGGASRTQPANRRFDFHREILCPIIDDPRWEKRSRPSSGAGVHPVACRRELQGGGGRDFHRLPRHAGIGRRCPLAARFVGQCHNEPEARGQREAHADAPKNGRKNRPTRRHVVRPAATQRPFSRNGSALVSPRKSLKGGGRGDLSPNTVGRSEVGLVPARLELRLSTDSAYEPKKLFKKQTTAEMHADQQASRWRCSGLYGGGVDQR